MVVLAALLQLHDDDGFEHSMSEDTARFIAGRPSGKLGVMAAARSSRQGWSVGWRGIGAIAVAVCLGMGLYIHRYEGGAYGQLYVAAATLLSGALLVLATRRPLVALVAVPAFATVIVKAGGVKHRLVEMNLHAYDVVFYLSSGPTLSFWWSHYKPELMMLLTALTALFAVIALAYRIDATRVSRLNALIAVGMLTLATAGAARLKGERSHTQQYWDDLTLSTFYSSIADTAEALWRGQLIEAEADAAHGKRFTIPATCPLDKTPPNIVLIHQESVVPPAVVPKLDYDRARDGMFTSFDGRTHPMRVETYGGASWLTEFSILTGVSTYSFGGMRAFVHSLMSGKIRDTLPQSLTRCGYRNVVFFPGDKNFVSYARFYTAAGMSEIIDSRQMKAKRLNERDSFFYGHALKEMEKHFKNRSGPLFTYLLTMATHGPYNTAYMPEVSVSGGGPGTLPEMNEYLRRLAMAHEDLDAFLGTLERRFPDQQFLVVHYGDHHPVATRAYLGYADIDTPQDVPLPRDSAGYQTYYSMRGIRYTPPALPDAGILDVPYLGTVLLKAAGLPLSDANAERQRLMTVCEGRYYGCSDRKAILSFHRRLIDSGLLDAH
jgi:hypothetical protein